MVKTFIDKVYLYDDHFTVLMNYAGRQGKKNKAEVLEIDGALESGVGSETCLVDAP